LADPTLVGRKQELAELRDFLDYSSHGKGITVLISGEAGSGKTRLAKEFLKVVQDKVTVLSGWCLSTAAIPYFPFVEAFDSFSAIDDTTAGNENQNIRLKKWLTSQNSNAGQNFNFQAWKDQTFESVTKELLLLSTQKPVIVFIDDIHWADSASISLFQYIARAIVDERILLMATFRSEELNQIANPQNQPLTETLRIMRREDLYREIKLKGLNQTEISDIAKSMLGSKASQKLVRQLSSETAGNPLFVIESLKMLAEQKELIQKEDGWTTKQEQFGIIPDKIKDVIIRRLNTLTPEARDVLDVGSVIGDKFDAQIIGSVLDQSSIKILSILNAISKSKSLVCCEHDRFLFDHPKTRETLYEEIAPPLKKEYHLRIAQKLENARQTNPAISLSDLAYHYVNSSDKKNAIKYSIEAGKTALSRFSNTEAIKNFNYVLNEIDDLHDDEAKAIALEGLGDAYYASTMLEEAIKTYKKLAILNFPSKVRALRKAMDAAFFETNGFELCSLLEEAQKCEITDPLENARILMNKARVTSRSGNPALAVKYFEEGVKLAEEQYSPWDVAWILVGLGSTRLWTGQLEESLAELLRAAEIFRDIGDTRWLIEAYNAIGNSFIGHFGLKEEAVQFLKKAAETDHQAKVEDWLRLAQINASWARAVASEDKIADALEKSLEALKYAEKTDSGWAKGVAFSNLTMFYGLMGEKEKTEEYFTKLMALPEDVQKNSYVGTPIARACFLACKGKNLEAKTVLEGVFAALKDINAIGVEANARLIYAGILQKQGQNERANQQKDISQKIYNTIIDRLEKSQLYAYIMAPANVTNEKEFEIRIDVVNISLKPVKLNKIENIGSSDLIILSCSTTKSTVKNKTIELGDQILEKFSAKSIKLTAKIPIAGTATFSPIIVYTNEFNSRNTSKTRTIITRSESVQVQLENIGLSPVQDFGLKSNAAENIYDFLLKSLKEDYKLRRMPKERSGWRTLMDIVHGAKVSRYNVYGFPHSQGQAITELQCAGLIEVRVFEGERGRGGKIVKVRATENQTLNKQR
jgi:tetratricopeptide (TPR) repeat protein